jgi:hypothetical protein
LKFKGLGMDPVRATPADLHEEAIARSGRCTIGERAKV